LFIDNASLYGPELEERLERTGVEVEGLMRLFSDQGVAPGGTILDLACGIGRHSLLLAEKGYRVVGVDISPTFIERAEELAAEKGVSGRVEFMVGDMRRVGELLGDRGEPFDAVVNLYTSHGYWDEATDRAIFSQACDLTKRGGIFVIHTVNRDFLVRHFQARDVSYGEGGRVVIMERRLDLECSRMFNVWKYYEQRGDDLEHRSTIELDHRVYSLHELVRQVEDAGWRCESSFGGYDMEPVSTDTFRMILVARKELG
jgi:SAM-dependent methyltransferase